MWKAPKETWTDRRVICWYHRRVEACSLTATELLDHCLYKSNFGTALLSALLIRLSTLDICDMDRPSSP
jgi:hypothetical protein